jgi:hypothetical protein
MPNPATYEDVNLILKLYELRREEKMRQARDWFGLHFHASSADDVQRIAPLGSQENAYFRMVTSYWEMVASFLTAGVLNQDLFFQSGGELLFVWERLRQIVPAMRESMKNPLWLRNLESAGNAFIQQMQAQTPEAYAAFQARIASIRAPEPAAQSK